MSLITINPQADKYFIPVRVIGPTPAAGITIKFESKPDYFWIASDAGDTANNWFVKLGGPPIDVSSAFQLRGGRIRLPGQSDSITIFLTSAAELQVIGIKGYIFELFPQSV